MESIHISLVPERLGEIGGVPLTNTLITSWVAMVVLFAVAWWIRRMLTPVPSKTGQVLAEVVIGEAAAYLEEVLGSRALARAALPVILTIFLYVTTVNLIGLLPGVGSVGVWQDGELVPLLYPPATDLNLPLALALISFMTIEYFGLRTLGFQYLGKFINVRSITGFFIGIIEFISELARIVSFTFRLFGNIFAGKVLLLVLMVFVPFVIPAIMMGFEGFVGIVQGAIFALLTLFFVKIAIEEHGEETH